MKTELSKARIFRELKAKFDHHKPIMERAMAALDAAERRHKAKAA
ncbi:MAG: hypothetical protein ACYCY2_00780 [Acidithiobacillus ferriphilus]|nr:hypothetical protein [Acidithiobacillus ferriphilus]